MTRNRNRRYFIFIYERDKNKTKKKQSYFKNFKVHIFVIESKYLLSTKLLFKKISSIDSYKYLMIKRKLVLVHK